MNRLCRVGGCPEYQQQYGYCYKHQANRRLQNSRTRKANPNNTLRAKIYADSRWKKTRAIVLERDGYACVRCLATEDLTVDHIYGVLVIDPYDPDECQTLCRSCHGTKSNEDKR